VDAENTTLGVDAEGTFGVDAEVDVNDNTPSSYWLETIEKRGVATFNNASSTYKVFRNVRDYGAKGIYILLSPSSHFPKSAANQK
jgi:glucan 1,3-beta-glucosidase